MGAWIHHAGAGTLGRVAGEYGLKCLPAGNSGVQMGGWFNKEINSADDLKGLKMRIPASAATSAKLGASPVSCPAARFMKTLFPVPSKQRNGSPVKLLCDEVLAEATKYYYFPACMSRAATPPSV